MRWIRLSLLAPAASIALCAATLSGCGLFVLGAASGAAFSIADDRRSPGTQFDDETIQARTQIRVSDRFGSKVHVIATSFNHMVLLTGQAPDESTRQEIGNITLGVPGVRAISNEVQLGEPSTRGSRLNDEIITSKVKARFINSGKVSPTHAKVVTEESVVYLLGLVTEQEAAAAVEVARTTGGVRKVVRIFEICSEQDEACRPRRTLAPPQPQSPG